MPTGIALDPAGNLYITDTGNSTIRKLTTSGVSTTVAGSPSQPGSANGTGASAGFSAPAGVASDSAGNLYVADSNNHTVRAIDPTGVVTTFAGSGVLGGKDGTGTAAQFDLLRGMISDGAGNLYIANGRGNTIRKIAPGRIVTTVAGAQRVIGSTDGAAANALFQNPIGVAPDLAGNLYVADSNNSTVRKITPGGIVSTFAGLVGKIGNVDGTGSDARFGNPTGVATDSAGNVYVADQLNSTIRKITPAGAVTTLAGRDGVSGIGSTDGPGTVALFNGPTSLVIDAAGNLYIADTGNATIRKLTPDGTVSTIAGTAGHTGILLGAAPRFQAPNSLTIVGDDLIISDANAILRLRHAVQ
jgi:sugar lactone lactonase YvrE